MTSTVAIVRTRPATVLADYHRVMNLAGYQDVLAREADTALKVNISWHFFFPGSSTTPWQLDGVVRAMLRDGYRKELIHACHNRTVVIDARLGERENKQLAVVQAHGLRNVHLYDGEEWVHIRDAVGDLADRFLCLNDVYPDGFHIPKRFIGENIVHLPTVKTHVFTTTTGAMKNAFGGLLNERRHWTHPVIHETLVDLLRIQQAIHRGVFAVMDGTFAGDGPGPRCMTPSVRNVLLASADQVAIDAVAAKIMGFDPLSIRYIRLAHEAGLGCGDPRAIRIVGDVDRPGKLALRRPLPEDDVRVADAAQDLLGAPAAAARVVAEDGAGAVGLRRQRSLSRYLLVSDRRARPHAERARQRLGAPLPELGDRRVRRGGIPRRRPAGRLHQEDRSPCPCRVARRARHVPPRGARVRRAPPAGERAAPARSPPGPMTRQDAPASHAPVAGVGRSRPASLAGPRPAGMAKTRRLGILFTGVRLGIGVALLVYLGRSGLLDWAALRGFLVAWPITVLAITLLLLDVVVMAARVCVLMAPSGLHLSLGASVRLAFIFLRRAATRRFEHVLWED